MSRMSLNDLENGAKNFVDSINDNLENRSNQKAQAFADRLMGKASTPSYSSGRKLWFWALILAIIVGFIEGAALFSILESKGFGDDWFQISMFLCAIIWYNLPITKQKPTTSFVLVQVITFAIISFFD